MKTVTPSDSEWFIEVTTVELIKELLTRVHHGSITIVDHDSDELHIFVTDDIRQAARVTDDASKRLAKIVKLLK